MKSKTTLLTFYLFLGLSSIVLGQSNFQFPKGYHSYKDYNGKEQRIDKDFDNDGIMDLAIVCAKKNDKDIIIVVFLTSSYLVKGTYYYFPTECADYGFEYKNNVLNISCGNGKFSTVFKLKYYSNLKNMRLIGYDSEYGGAGMNGGGYKKSINLLTNEYTVNGIKKKTSFDVITLTNIEKYFDYLDAIGSNYMNQ